MRLPPPCTVRRAGGADPSPRMKLHNQNSPGLNTVTAYGVGHIAVNGQPLAHSFLLTPETLETDWPPASIAELNEAHLARVAALGCRIVLLGTGLRQRFPPPALLAPLIGAGIGVEVMDSLAACRTYNILMAEGRDVAAAVIVEAAA